MQVGSKIRKIRELRGYSQEVVADLLGITQNSYSKIESDATNITVKRLYEIAKVLEVEVPTILGFDEKQVFNANFNDSSVNGGSDNSVNGGNVVYLENSFNKERELYQAQIKQLQEEVAFLRKLLEEKSKN